MGDFLCSTAEDGWMFGGAWVAGTVGGDMSLDPAGVGLGGFRITGMPVVAPTIGAWKGGAFGTATDLTASQTTTLYAAFSFQFWSTNAVTGTLSVFVMPTNSPQAFSTGNPPTVQPKAIGVLSNITTPAGGLLSVPVIPRQATQIATLYQARNWVGNLAFALQWVSAGAALVLTSASGAGTVSARIPQMLTTGDYPIDTGLMPGPWMSQGRIDRCPRCGQRSSREEWVLDGFYKRLVCTKNNCFDPEDEDKRPIRVPFERPSINNEG